MSYSKSFMFPWFLQLFLCLPSQCPLGGRGVVRQKVDRRGQGKGGGLKVGKSVWTSCMDGPNIEANHTHQITLKAYHPLSHYIKSHQICRIASNRIISITLYQIISCLSHYIKSHHHIISLTPLSFQAYSA